MEPLGSPEVLSLLRLPFRQPGIETGAAVSQPLPLPRRATLQGSGSTRTPQRRMPASERLRHQVATRLPAMLAQ